MNPCRVGSSFTIQPLTVWRGKTSNRAFVRLRLTPEFPDFHAAAASGSASHGQEYLTEYRNAGVVSGAETRVRLGFLFGMVGIMALWEGVVQWRALTVGKASGSTRRATLDEWTAWNAAADKVLVF